MAPHSNVPSSQGTEFEPSLDKGTNPHTHMSSTTPIVPTPIHIVPQSSGTFDTVFACNLYSEVEGVEMTDYINHLKQEEEEEESESEGEEKEEEDVARGGESLEVNVNPPGGENGDICSAAEGLCTFFGIFILSSSHQKYRARPQQNLPSSDQVWIQGTP